jgi:YD repeat-containing protein
MEQRLKVTTFLLMVLSLLGLNQPSQGKQPSIHYVYDDLGRLVGVVDQNGNAATYVYDAVGNILAIERRDVADSPDAVVITLVSPNEGRVGTPVSIYGRGFSLDAAQNIVAFSGAVASVTGVSTNLLSTVVPQGALTGPITLTTPLGTASSPEPFTVVGVLTINPTSTVLFTTQTQQFTASVTGASTASVTWGVNGMVGGNTTVGAISPAGLYTAPAQVPSPPTVTVTAIDTSDPILSAAAEVAIVATPDQILASAVSIGFAGPSAVSVNSLIAEAVSVQIAPSMPPSMLLAVPISVQVAPTPVVFVAPQALTVAHEPIITDVSPSNAPRGASNLPVTIAGSGLAGATDLRFLLTNVGDASITVANLWVNPTGTLATAEITIANDAPVGARVVRLSTPSDGSTPVGTGGNLFVVE